MAGGARKNADGALVAVLAAGATVADAAKRCGVSESTIFRRLRDESFRQELAGARSQMIEAATGMLAAGAAEAVKTVHSLLKSKSESVRLAAARTQLEYLCRTKEVFELLSRLDALEQRLLGAE